MTFLAPGFFYAAIVASAVIIALHLIVTLQPRAAILPTARFVPDVPTVAMSRAVRPYDLLLLLLRVLLLLAIGAALARPILKPRRERMARVIVADVSGSVASRSEVVDSVRSLYRPGDVTVTFDSAAHITASIDSLAVDRHVPADPGSLSAALVGALHAASGVREGADSVELVLVSPFAAGEHDLATDNIRALWPGRARLVRVARDSTPRPHVSRVTWSTAVRPALAVSMPRPDTSDAVIVDGDVVVAPFARRWSFPKDSLRGATVVARWVDGAPAAVERIVESGCERSITIPVDSTGDLVLRPEFIRLRQRLSDACGSLKARAGPDSAIASLGGTGRLAAAAFFPAPMDVESPLAPWLVAIAIALALIELIVRRGRNER